MKILLTAICLLLSTCASAITPQEKELAEKWIQAKQDFSIMQRGGGKVVLTTRL
jgi:starvation-inducible outer membrane lipoprotein